MLQQLVQWFPEGLTASDTYHWCTRDQWVLSGSAGCLGFNVNIMQVHRDSFRVEWALCSHRVANWWGQWPTAVARTAHFVPTVNHSCNWSRASKDASLHPKKKKKCEEGGGRAMLHRHRHRLNPSLSQSGNGTGHCWGRGFANCMLQILREAKKNEMRQVRQRVRPANGGTSCFWKSRRSKP